MGLLYAIADNAADMERYVRLGLPLVQYRDKQRDAFKLDLPASPSRLILNDDYNAAAQLGWWGAHLGQEDLASIVPPRTRALRKLKLGISTHNQAELDYALSFEPDYLAFGPIFKSASKDLSFAPQGIERLKSYIDQVKVPVVAIGGIDPDNSIALLKTGIYAIAVIGALKALSDREILCWNEECINYAARYEL